MRYAYLATAILGGLISCVGTSAVEAIDIPKPVINIPKPNIPRPTINVPKPKVTINVPKSGVNVPKVNVLKPVVNVPKVDVPKAVVNVPKPAVVVPEVDVAKPAVAVTVPKLGTSPPVTVGPLATPTTVVATPKNETGVSSPKVGGPVPPGAELPNLTGLSTSKTGAQETGATKLQVVTPGSTPPKGITKGGASTSATSTAAASPTAGSAKLTTERASSNFQTSSTGAQTLPNNLQGVQVGQLYSYTSGSPQYHPQQCSGNTCSGVFRGVLPAGATANSFGGYDCSTCQPGIYMIQVHQVTGGTVNVGYGMVYPSGTPGSGNNTSVPSIPSVPTTPMGQPTVPVATSVILNTPCEYCPGGRFMPNVPSQPTMPGASVPPTVGSTISNLIQSAIVGPSAEAEQTTNDGRQVLTQLQKDATILSDPNASDADKAAANNRIQQALAGQPPSGFTGDSGSGSNGKDPGATPTPSPSPTPQDVRLRDLPDEQAPQYLSDHGNSLTPEDKLQLSGPLLNAYDKGLLTPAQVDQLKSITANVPNTLDNGLSPSQNTALANLRSNTAASASPPAATGPGQPPASGPSDPSLPTPQQGEQNKQNNAQIHHDPVPSIFDTVSKRYQAKDRQGEFLPDSPAPNLPPPR